MAGPANALYIVHVHQTDFDVTQSGYYKMKAEGPADGTLLCQTYEGGVVKAQLYVRSGEIECTGRFKLGPGVGHYFYSEANVHAGTAKAHLWDDFYFPPPYCPDSQPNRIGDE